MFELNMDKLKRVYENNIELMNKLMPESGKKKEIIQEHINWIQNKLNELNNVTEIFANDGVKTAEIIYNHETNEEEFYIVVPVC
jgi:DNA-binding protein H-NS